MWNKLNTNLAYFFCFPGKRISKTNIRSPFLYSPYFIVQCINLYQGNATWRASDLALFLSKLVYYLFLIQLINLSAQVCEPCWLLRLKSDYRPIAILVHEPGHQRVSSGRSDRLRPSLPKVRQTESPIQGGPERMQHLRSLISKKSGTKSNWVEHSSSSKMTPRLMILMKAFWF